MRRLRMWLPSIAAVSCLLLTAFTARAQQPPAQQPPLPFAPDWRWLLGREDCPWYPTLRLFRQERPGDWAAVFARIADELRTRLQIEK